MAQAILALAFVALVPADAPPRKDTPRERHPLAPSLPQLTAEEETKIEGVIDRFIDYDTGKLRGAEGRKALEDFKRLGPEAIPPLIDGLNRAANLGHSCATVIIARKLAVFLGATNDQQLLDFARETIGAGVTATRHQGVIKDLRVACMVRKSVVQRQAMAAWVQAKPGPSPLRSMSVAQLVEAAGSERGPHLKMVLVELEQRKGNQVINALGAAASSYEPDIRQLARVLLVRHLSRQTGTAVKAKLKDDRPAVRAAAAEVIAVRGWRFGSELIDLLSDADADVRQAARRALVQLARGTDYGPEANATAAERADAIRQWDSWWAAQTGK
jgi:hypothetical protein